MPKEKTDEELMLAYQLGDEEAFREIYFRYSGRVFGFIQKKLRDTAQAQDLFQSVFFKLHRSRQQYNPSFLFAPWLFTICRSELLDYFKKSQQRKEVFVTEVPEEVQPLSSQRTDIELSVLKPDQKKALSMRVLQQASFDEIASELKTSPANARQLVSRAAKVLRSIYAKK